MQLKRSLASNCVLKLGGPLQTERERDRQSAYKSSEMAKRTMIRMRMRMIDGDHLRLVVE